MIARFQSRLLQKLPAGIARGFRHRSMQQECNAAKDDCGWVAPGLTMARAEDAWLRQHRGSQSFSLHCTGRLDQVPVSKLSGEQDLHALISAAAAVTAALALGGCVTATPILTPSGQQGFTLNCSAMNDIGQCYKKAGDLCGSNGYQIYDQNNKPVGFWSGANQTMVVRCKAPGEAGLPTGG